ncbi:VOC family protein [Fredinandcohnia humi]
MPINVIPYLVMDGNAKEAIDFYKEVFNADVLGIITFGEMPPNPDFPMPEEEKNRVSHATIKIGDSVLMFSDTFPGQAHQKGNQVTICITLEDPEEAISYFEPLQKDGQVGMPLQKTDFSPAYGIVTDKFDVTFQIYTESQH